MRMTLIEMKQTVEKEGKGTVVDFTEPTLIVDKNSADFHVESAVMVDEEMAMRPDKVSIAAYGTDEYVDIILKANEISNPYTLEVGDILLIPERELAKNFYRSPERLDEKEGSPREVFTTPERASRKDKGRREKLKRIAKKRKNGSSEVRPPNELRNGERPFTIDGGRVDLGNQ